MGLFDRMKKHESPVPITGISESAPLSRSDETQWLKLSDAMLAEARSEIEEKTAFSFPLSQLLNLGGIVASMVPAIRSVTQTSSVDTSNLYTWVNQAVGDTLKFTKKDATFNGGVNTASGKNKFAKFRKMDQLSVTTSTTLPIDPMTLMMAVVLFSIEQKIDGITETCKEILAFLHEDKESEIEADLTLLNNIIIEYKYNWNKEQYLSTHQKYVMDIRRTAAKNIRFYQKQIEEVLKGKQLLVLKHKIKEEQKKLQHKFQYYRLSLYIYAMASFLEVILLGNYQEEYLMQVKSDIVALTSGYHSNYQSSVVYLKMMADSVIESSALAALGNSEKAVGALIGSIPGIKNGLVDEWLMEKGARMKDRSEHLKSNAFNGFDKVSDAGTSTFVERFDEINRIYNHTASICFDYENIYFIEQKSIIEEEA